ncbi:DNA topoisomerase III [Anaerotruncus sp. G3(2012)]|uniref:DNA topoisomerase 3 n=1 Tax=Anaerotruncus sp. G3(2012) TaxID=1235835 RepID=UPI00033C3CA6|nr:DNA topoisomerase 3 [Anaerotruncus sp. G3(2012)]EOS54856.1 DNA topoisomerase III [Anaerotruncus sp. G3(2012)]
MKLVIAEKPSVARSIAAVIGATDRQEGYLQGNGYLVSWCIGHLVSFADAALYDERFKKWRYEDLPIIPESWRLTVPPDKRERFDTLRTLLRSEEVSEVINACDAGREGELIFRTVYHLAGCTKPMKRLWISSMEDSAIREGFANLKPGRDYDPLHQSALCRAKADWLIGINATRLFSVLYHKTLTVGRVQTPTLKMLVDRDAKITGFQKEKYHIVHIAGGGMEAASDRFPDPAEAESVKTACAGAQAVCASVVREKKAEQPPKLYDLTTLQREANRLFGFTAKQTLDYAQTLYEKRLLTYPRTDSRFLSDDMEQTATGIVAGIVPMLVFMEGAAFSPEIRRVLNSAKVSDHHAIIPTAEFVKQGFSGLADSERKLLSLVCCKLLCAVAPAHEYEAVTAVFTCAGQEFTAKGKTVLAAGWKDIDRRFRASLKTDADEDGEAVAELPELAEGQVFEDVAASVTEHFTSPPKPYTEDTLLSAMERAGAEDMPDDAERKGLGTPATRASILEKLVQMGFVQRKGKQLLPTKDGINLAAVLPEALTSPALTAEWETRLSEIAKGEADPDEFMAGIEAQARDLVTAYSCISEDKQKLFQTERVAIGTCPRCGETVYEGKKNYYCGNRACQFVMWKNDRFFEERKKAFTPKIAAALLKHGKVKIKGLFSPKTGKTYDGTVLLADTGGKYVNFRMEWKKQ